MKANVISKELKEILIGYCSSSFKNEKGVKKASGCFCYSCCYSYLPEAIFDWCDDTEDNKGNRTAICPVCGIDSVVPIGPDAPDHPGFIKLLNIVLMGASDSVTADDLYYIDEETEEKVFFEVSLEESPTGKKFVRISNKKQ